MKSPIPTSHCHPLKLLRVLCVFGIFPLHQGANNHHGFATGSIGSAGAFPPKMALTYCAAVEMQPHVRPATTPASTMFLQGYARCLTA
mmetsp:Transcript_9414/g.21671  ORF Transcript_9414/g.21671 Transcript_9414/m.21671 type:complete len:88 (+) Transcript_9414:38-301(+)